MEVARGLALVVGLLGLAAYAQTADPDVREATAFTSQGKFEQAIPHFLAAKERGNESFAVNFNLALCYVAVQKFADAIRILDAIPASSHAAEVKALLAQSYAGNRQPEAAWKAFEESIAVAPDRERAYLLVFQALLDQGFNDYAQRVLEQGLQHLPGSARLHFERGFIYSLNDENGRAKREFEEAQRLSPASEIAYIATAEEAFVDGRLPDVIRSARDGVRAGYGHYLLLTLLGEALLRSGATPSSPQFLEAQNALEQATAKQPGYSSSHIALGRIYLALGRNSDAIAQLEAAHRLDPRNKALYPPLASAYQRSSLPDRAKEALAALAALNREEAARIGSANGGHAGYVSKGGKNR